MACIVAACVTCIMAACIMAACATYIMAACVTSIMVACVTCIMAACVTCIMAAWYGLYCGSLCDLYYGGLCDMYHGSLVWLVYMAACVECIMAAQMAFDICCMAVLHGLYYWVHILKTNYSSSVASECCWLGLGGVFPFLILLTLGRDSTAMDACPVCGGCKDTYK